MSIIDSSSDDDCYVNSAKTLKALKQKLTVTAILTDKELSPSPQDVIPSLVVNDCSVSEAPQTRSARSLPSVGKNNQRTRNNKDPDKSEYTPKFFDEKMPVESISLIDSDTDDVTIVKVPNDSVDPDPLGNDIDENYEITVKVNWQSARIERIPLRRFQEFSKVFDYYSAMANISQEKIWLVLRNQITIQPSDTPDSLGLTIVDIIEGGIIDGNTEHNTANTNVDKDSINIKIQTKDQKKTLSMCIKKSQKIKVLIMKCAEQLQIPQDKIKFQFDGEPVHPHETPESLDLEGGECFDMHIIP